MRDAMISAPAELPVSWDELKHHLRLSWIDPEQEEPEKLYVQSLAKAATEVAAGKLRRAIVEATYEIAAGWWEFAEPLELPWPTLQTIVSVSVNGVPLLETDYRVGPKRTDGGYFVPAFLEIPAARVVGSVTNVVYRAGYGTALEVPESIKRWICLRTAALYETREEIIDTRALIPVPFMDSLLNEERWFQFSGVPEVWR